MPKCIHCENVCEKLRTKGLCPRCYSITAIRKVYPRSSAAKEMTEAELDAMIAERLPTMPEGYDEQIEKGIKANAQRRMFRRGERLGKRRM